LGIQNIGTHILFGNVLLQKKWPKNKVVKKNVAYESPIFVNSREFDRLVLGVTTRREMEEQTTMPSMPRFCKDCNND